MSIKINDKIISIPPYLSTSWSHISSLSMKDNLLNIKLGDGSQIQIPNLSNDTIEMIFNQHAAYLDRSGKEISSLQPFDLSNENQVRDLLSHSDGSPFKIGFGTLD